MGGRRGGARSRQGARPSPGHDGQAACGASMARAQKARQCYPRAPHARPRQGQRLPPCPRRHLGPRGRMVIHKLPH